MLAFMLLIISCSTKNTPLPQLEGNLRHNWIPIGEDSYGNQWYLYSGIDMDFGNYVVQYQLEMSSLARENYSVSFVPFYAQYTYLVDTLLSKNQLVNSMIVDSLCQKSHTFNVKAEQWEYMRPNTIMHDAAPIAEMLYKDAHRTTKVESPYDVSWGNGKWILYQTLNDRQRYVNSNVQETDSSYIMWRYTQYTITNEGLLLAYMYSNQNMRQLIYGCVFKYEALKKDNMYRTLECYYVDKFGTPIYEDSSYYGTLFPREENELDMILQKVNRHP